MVMWNVRVPGAQAQRGRAGLVVAPEEHELLAALDLADHRPGGVPRAHPVDLELGVVQGLGGDLAPGQQELPEHVVRVRDLGVEAATGLADQAHERPVGAVAHQEAEHAHVVLLRELPAELGGIALGRP